MDEVDTGGESPIRPGGTGSPDLTRIEGMGLRITTSPGQGAWIDINRIAITAP
jgi:hypothetical protein